MVLNPIAVKVLVCENLRPSGCSHCLWYCLLVVPFGWWTTTVTAVIASRERLGEILSVEFY
jgi:hypothetical protein